MLPKIYLNIIMTSLWLFLLSTKLCEQRNLTAYCLRQKYIVKTAMRCSIFFIIVLATACEFICISYYIKIILEISVSLNHTVAS